MRRWELKIIIRSQIFLTYTTQLAGAEEYANYISVEG